jgi:hypothetical protein
VQAAATCIQLGCNVAWPVRNGTAIVSALQYSAQQHNEALVYLLLQHDAPVGKALQSWHSHSDLARWRQYMRAVIELAVVIEQELVHPSRVHLLTSSNEQLQVAADLTEALPYSLQWAAPFALCAVRQDI